MVFKTSKTRAIEVGEVFAFGSHRKPKDRKIRSAGSLYLAKVSDVGCGSEISGVNAAVGVCVRRVPPNG